MPELADVAWSWPVREHEQVTDAHAFRFVADVVDSPGGEQLHRFYLDHPGSVAVLALDDNDRVLVERQYRHPVRMKLVELPAGILDVAGESALAGAQRELAEEARLAAREWHVLIDHFASPGCSSESLRVYLARGLSPRPRPEGFVVEGEEADMTLEWVALDDLVDGVLGGRLGNPNLAVGVLALALARATGRLDRLRPADAAWPARPSAV